ncbi:hypothetical protein [Streptomyces graminilatus]|uniref:hypothetical protein n=1 Tax=Streptomyces graminilatus TaxID=1464070 RepID=UPI0012FF59EB|nr:hypothetical protein [Streptomyces graminilatus]
MSDLSRQVVVADSMDVLREMTMRRLSPQPLLAKIEAGGPEKTSVSVPSRVTSTDVLLVDLGDTPARA